MKLMNFHSLAEFIQPQVQQLSGKETSINTLVVAIKRFSDTLSDSKSPNASGVLKDARISLSSGIVDVTISFQPLSKNCPRLQPSSQNFLTSSLSLTRSN